MEIDLRYPVGKFKAPERYDDSGREEALKNFGSLPKRLREVLNGVGSDQLKNRYRPEGWSIRQVVHHLADSHMNCLIRFKLALTEGHPTIKPYIESLWATMPDADNDEINDSLLIIEGVHNRVMKLLSSVGGEDWERKVFHPESKRDMSVDFLLALYSWHCNHHLAHIKNALSNPY